MGEKAKATAISAVEKPSLVEGRGLLAAATEVQR